MNWNVDLMPIRIQILNIKHFWMQSFVRASPPKIPFQENLNHKYKGN